MIFAHPHDPSQLVKLYREPRPPRRAALERVVGLTSSVTASVRERLAIPLAVVEDDEAGLRIACGVTVPHAGAPYQCTLSGYGVQRTAPLDATYLVRAQRATKVGAPAVSHYRRLEIVRQLLDTYAGVHEAGWLVQDISETNVLWAADAEPAVFVIDVDSFRHTDGPGAFPGRHSPGYVLPDWPADRQDRQSDTIKAARLAGRVLAGDPRWPDAPQLTITLVALEQALRRIAVARRAGVPGATMRELADVVAFAAVREAPPGTALAGRMPDRRQTMTTDGAPPRGAEPGASLASTPNAGACRTSMPTRHASARWTIRMALESAAPPANGDPLGWILAWMAVAGCLLGVLLGLAWTALR